MNQNSGKWVQKEARQHKPWRRPPPARPCALWSWGLPSWESSDDGVGVTRKIRLTFWLGNYTSRISYRIGLQIKDIWTLTPPTYTQFRSASAEQKTSMDFKLSGLIAGTGFKDRSKPRHVSNQASNISSITQKYSRRISNLCKIT